MSYQRITAEKQYGASAFFLFLLMPFLGFIRACGRLKDRLCGVVFVAFYTLFGYAHSFTDRRADAFRKYWEFTHFHKNTFGSIWQDFISGELPDPFEHLLYCLVRKFSVNPHVMMGTVALFGGIFIYLAIRRLLQDYRGKYNRWYYLLVILLVIALNPLSIGGIRQYGTIGILVYSSIRILIDKKYIWFIPLCLTPLIHFSALLWLPVFAIALFARRIPRNLLLWGAIVACALGNTLESSGYRDAIMSAFGSIGLDNDAISAKTTFYASKASDRLFGDSITTQVSRASNIISSIYFVIVLLIINKKLKRLRFPKQLDKIWRLYLLFSIVGYTMVGLSVVGNRYLVLSSVYTLLLWFNIYSRYPQWRTMKKIIVWRYVCGSFSLALLAYNIYTVVFHEVFWAPIPLIIERGLTW